MNNYVKHAMTEWRAAGFVDENGNYCDEMQRAICEHVIKLLDVFDEEGHSGTSAPYAIKMFSALASFEPIVPLTGEDWEWAEVNASDELKYQNKRCGHVFKGADGRAYDGKGKVFYDYYTDEDGKHHKSYYTCSESRVYIEFPYTPITEYVYRKSGAE